MCGIVGIFNTSGKAIPPGLLHRMVDAVSHRGPDGQGVYLDDNVGLGHTRLAVIDLSALAAQPMESADGRYILTFNGEIYNFRELREQLRERGYSFRSHSDTEVLLTGFIAWKHEILNKLNGMFAFAIWDNLERTLFLARDRYGIKPLYLYSGPDGLVFASEIKAILQHPDYQVGIDKQALFEYLTFQNFISERTLFKDVSIFPAGHYVEVSQARPQCKPVQYWDFHFSNPTARLSEQEYEEETRRLFAQAVQRQLVSDVPVGSYLSGGMDSGSVAGIASKYIDPLLTFTCGFDINGVSPEEAAFDERLAAEEFSNYFSTRQFEVILKHSDMERIFAKLVHHLEEPRVGQSYPNFLVADLASKHVKVVLSGAGGDELFGGYPWRYYRPNQTSSYLDFQSQHFEKWQRLVPAESRRTFFDPIWSEIDPGQPRTTFDDVFKDLPRSGLNDADYINYCLYFEAKTFLHGLLVVDDKLSMAHGLETRLPFLDNDLVDFALGLPVDLKVGMPGSAPSSISSGQHAEQPNYHSSNSGGKLILRSAMAPYLPTSATQRRKQGFSAPDASWFRTESRSFVAKYLLDPESLIFQFVDFGEVSKLVSQHILGVRNHRLLIWSLLHLEFWCREFLGGASLHNDTA